MLRDYQLNAVESALNFYKYRAGHGYVTAPGGSGKSHMIAGVGERLFDLGARVAILARSEKLLTQNRSKFAPQYHEHIGIYCAGLGSKDATRPITIASIQSIANLTMPLDAVLVDECDEIPEDEESQYQQFFSNAGNPRVLGFTATPFRTKGGNISWGEEIINIPLAPIMKAGYLTPPTNKVGTTLDLAHIPISMGDYNQAYLDEIYADPELLELSVRKIKQYSAERSSVLIFCQSVKHADAMAHVMDCNAMPCTVVTGDTCKDELNDWILPDFEAGKIKYLINVMLLTRGYDMPCVDMIAVLRATKSKRLWEQILYRGTRLKPGKSDFLVLDMGNNFQEHGPLGSPYAAKGSREAAASKGKICPTCEDFTPPLARSCPGCGYEFPEAELRQVNHSGYADSTSATVYEGDISTYDVSDVTYKMHKSKKGNETLMVSYHTGHGKYGTTCEWYSPMHENEWARGKCAAMFKERGNELGSPTNSYTWDDLLWHASQLKKPKRITVDHGQEFARIIRFEWGDEPKLDTQQQVEAFLDDSIDF